MCHKQSIEQEFALIDRKLCRFEPIKAFCILEFSLSFGHSLEGGIFLYCSHRLQILFFINCNHKFAIKGFETYIYTIQDGTYQDLKTDPVRKTITLRRFMMMVNGILRAVARVTQRRAKPVRVYEKKKDTLLKKSRLSPFVTVILALTLVSLKCPVRPVLGPKEFVISLTNIYLKMARLT